MAVLGGLEISFTLTGDKELDRKFQELPNRLEKKVLREGLRPAAKLIRDAIIALIPKRTGNAAQQLKVRAAKRSRRTPDRVALDVVTRAGFFRGQAFYLRIVDQGWLLGSRRTYTMKSGVARYKLGTRWLVERKPIAGQHWMERGFKRVESAAKTLAIQKIGEGIEREAASLG